MRTASIMLYVMMVVVCILSIVYHRFNDYYGFASDLTIISQGLYDTVDFKN